MAGFDEEEGWIGRDEGIGWDEALLPWREDPISRRRALTRQTPEEERITSPRFLLDTDYQVARDRRRLIQDYLWFLNSRLEGRDLSRVPAHIRSFISLEHIDAAIEALSEGWYPLLGSGASSELMCSTKQDPGSILAVVDLQGAPGTAALDRDGNFRLLEDTPQCASVGRMDGNCYRQYHASDREAGSIITLNPASRWIVVRTPEGRRLARIKTDPSDWSESDYPGKSITFEGREFVFSAGSEYVRLHHPPISFPSVGYDPGQIIHGVTADGSAVDFIRSGPYIYQIDPE